VSWLSDLTWNNGWSFLVPYAALFLVAWGLDVPLVYLIKSFLALHAVVVVLLLFHLLKKFRARELFLSDLFFLGAFFLFLFIPGVYLEFPSDPWGHFQRITMWQHAETVDDYPLLRLRVRFSYFLDWSVLSLFSVIDYRKGLSLIAALQQLFVAVQLFRLARAFGLTKGQSYAATVLFFVSFGTVLFSVRYYALSSFMLAFGAYLAALVLLIERFKGEKNCLWGILPLTVIIVLNHPQELLFLFMLTSSLMCLAFFRKYWSARLVGALILGLVLVYGSAFFFFQEFSRIVL